MLGEGPCPVLCKSHPGWLLSRPQGFAGAPCCSSFPEHIWRQRQGHEDPRGTHRPTPHRPPPPAGAASPSPVFVWPTPPRPTGRPARKTKHASFRRSQSLNLKPPGPRGLFPCRRVGVNCSASSASFCPALLRTWSCVFAGCWLRLSSLFWWSA
jgi:hypothetical protein